MKKLIALVLALALVLLCVGAAFAANDGTLTVEGKEGYSYSIYRVLDVEYNEVTGAFRYFENTKWASFYATTTFTNAFDVSTENDVTYVAAKSTFNDAAAAGFAKDALAYAKANSIAADGTSTAAAANAEGKEIASFSSLPYGYYLVDSSMGALCVLNSAIPNQTVHEKNEVPEIEKKIVEGESLVDENSASIGDTVTYRAKITVQTGAENYVMHDVMEAGLTYQGVTSVKIGDADVPAANYTINADPTDDCTFEISFDNTYMAGLTAGTEILVVYTAKINENAEIATESNDNTVTLKYGDGTRTETTPPDTVKTYVYKFDLIKTNAANIVIEGATFKLYKTKSAAGVVSDEVALVADGTNYRVAKEGETPVETISAGKPTISGLKSGTYYLKEITAPAGYNLLPDAIDVVLNDANNTATLNHDAESGSDTWVSGGAHVINQSGTTLPSTGGIGTTIFYILGGLLVVGAAVILVARRKAHD